MTHSQEDVCAALPGWIAQVEKEEASKGVPSAQFWKRIRMAFDLDCVIGCSPLVAPSSFQQVLKGRGEGWGTSHPPSSLVYNLLHLPADEQWHLCQNFKADGCWYALSRGSTLDHLSRDRLSTLGVTLTVFGRGNCTAAAEGSWTLAKLKAVRTAQDWTLWASRRATGDAADQERQRLRLSSLQLTEDGVLPVDLACPSAREVLQGQVGVAYSKECVVVATDGALKHDSAMGAAFVALGEGSPPAARRCLDRRHQSDPNSRA